MLLFPNLQMKVTAKHPKRLKITTQLNPVDISKSAKRVRMEDGVEIITLNLQQPTPAVQNQKVTNLISDDDNTMECEEGIPLTRFCETFILILIMFQR